MNGIKLHMLWCLLVVFPFGIAAGQESCDEGELWEPYAELCAQVRDKREEFLPGSAEQPWAGKVGEPDPGGLAVGITFRRNQLVALESGRLHTRMFVHPEGLQADGPLPLLYTPARNRVQHSPELVGIYTDATPGRGRLGLFGWSCTPEYPCAGGSTRRSWQWYRDFSTLGCNITQTVDQGGHAQKVLYYANHTDKLDDGTPPQYRDAVYLWNYCDAAWDLAWSHTYREDKVDCSIPGAGCAWWGPALETFSDSYPQIAELGFEDSLLYHDGVWSDLRWPEAGFRDPEVYATYTPWQLFHLDPNRSYGVGNFLDENDAPSIEEQSELTTLEDEAIELNEAHLVISDPDVDPAYHSSFELTLYGGENYTFSETRVIPAGNFAGTLTVPVSVNDGAAESPVFDLEIDVLPVNDLPAFAGTPPTDATQDALYVYEIQAQDPDGDALEISAPTLPAWLTVTDNGNGTAILEGTAGNADVGEHEVELMADDGQLGVATQVFTIVVANVNDAPVFTSTPNANATEGLLYTYRITTEDPDDDIVTISAPVLPGWLSLTDQGDGTATLTGTPGNSDAGNHPVQLLADDGNQGTVTQDFTITVADVNSAPNFTSTPPDAITEGNEYRYLIAVSDPDLDTIAITAPTLPGWLTFTDQGDGTATLAGTPTGTEVGQHPVGIVAADSLGATVGQQFTITVTAAADGPVITLNGDASITTTVGQPYDDAGATASDPQDGDLTDSIIVDNPVDTGQAGIYTITYTVEDTAGNTAQAQRTVAVQAAPPPPPVSSGGGGGSIGLAELLALVLAASLLTAGRILFPDRCKSCCGRFLPGPKVCRNRSLADIRDYSSCRLAQSMHSVATGSISSRFGLMSPSHSRHTP